MEPPNTPPVLQPRGNDKVWSMLCHLSALTGIFMVGILLPLVVYLAMKQESEYLARNSREALNFHLSVFIYAVCCFPLCLIVIGIPLLVILGIGTLIFSILAAVKASDGDCYHYPLTLRLVR